MLSEFTRHQRIVAFLGILVTVIALNYYWWQRDRAIIADYLNQQTRRLDRVEQLCGSTFTRQYICDGGRP